MPNTIERIERTVVIIKPDGGERGFIGAIITRIEEQKGLKIIAMEMVSPSEDTIKGHLSTNPEWLRTVGEKTIKYCQDREVMPQDLYGTINPEEIGRKIREWNISYLLRGRVVKILVEGRGAIEKVRNLVGATFPVDALPGTIRRDFSLTPPNSPITAGEQKRACENLVHASGSQEELLRDLIIWFHSPVAPL
ncbi:nucleoside-diphosphate kinase [Candidatus Berkelbacteria bacterium]|nr:nucleoside-diphosphate kinase [Candidatus Berkelbacteria bacterium]MBI2588487.1 nucleoside-diphosphate kinase [Candidatus Berkelbacteria bacterium]